MSAIANLLTGSLMLTGCGTSSPAPENGVAAVSGSDDRTTYACAPHWGVSRQVGRIVFALPFSGPEVEIVEPRELAGSYRNIDQQHAAPTRGLRLPAADGMVRLAEIRWVDDSHEHPDRLVMYEGPVGNTPLVGTWDCTVSEGSAS